jgi:hypothetical protein
MGGGGQPPTNPLWPCMYDLGFAVPGSSITLVIELPVHCFCKKHFDVSTKNKQTNKDHIATVQKM